MDAGCPNIILLGQLHLSNGILDILLNVEKTMILSFGQIYGRWELFKRNAIPGGKP